MKNETLAAFSVASLIAILIGLHLLRVQRNAIFELTKENQHLKEQIIKANTDIDLANRIINKPDSVCIWVKTKW